MKRKVRTPVTSWFRLHRLFLAIGAIIGLLIPVLNGGTASAAASPSYVSIVGAGSTWSQNEISQWIANVKSQGIQVSYTGNGSSAGRQAFLNGTVDFAASDIPFQSQPEDGSAPENPPAGSYAYIPITAGGTSFMYNLHINGQRVSNLRLSGEVLAKIFTDNITNWDDPAIAKDNPGLHLPNRKIIPVVRSDGSGSTAQFVLWMIHEYPSIWEPYCQKTGGTHCNELTSFFPAMSPPMVSQSGDLGVAGYVSASYADGAIGYVQYSYALNAHFPVVKMLNSAGYYTEPTPDNVAVSLLKAKVDTTDVNDPSKYLTEDLTGVYTDTDPRTYPLSLYSYLIIPTKTSVSFGTDQGYTLSAFADYAMCQGQQNSGLLGYSPMPYNLVEDTFTQIKKIPGAAQTNINIHSCNNPTLGPGGSNILVAKAPMPAACDKAGTTQCTTGTGGFKQTTALTGGKSNPNALVPVTTKSTGGAVPSHTAGGATAAGGGSGGATGTAATGSASNAPTGASSSASKSPSGTTVAAGTGAQTGSGASAAQCDADTGQCSGSSTGSANLTGSSQQAVGTSTVVPAAKGWSSTQTLMLIAGLLLLAIIVVPGLLYRRLERGK